MLPGDFGRHGCHVFFCAGCHYHNHLDSAQQLLWQRHNGVEELIRVRIRSRCKFSFCCRVTSKVSPSTALVSASSLHCVSHVALLIPFHVMLGPASLTMMLAPPKDTTQHANFLNGHETTNGETNGPFSHQNGHPDYDPFAKPDPNDPFSATKGAINLYCSAQTTSFFSCDAVFVEILAMLITIYRRTIRRPKRLSP